MGAKSGVMVFNAPRITKERVAITKWALFGEPVPVKQSYKYLGVVITTKITDWRPYFSKAIQKAQHASNLLIYICRHDKGMLPRAARSYWLAKVRPILEYAAEIWAGDLPQILVSKAEKIQSDFARRILGLHNADGISNQAILAELGLEPLRSRWYKLKLGYWRRIFTYKPSRLLREVITIHRAQTAAQKGYWTSIIYMRPGTTQYHVQGNQSNNGKRKFITQWTLSQIVNVKTQCHNSHHSINTYS